MSNYSLSTIGGKLIKTLDASAADYAQNLGEKYLSNLRTALNYLVDKTKCSYDIIPCILTTDVHSRFSESQLMGVYRWIAEEVDWQSISKVVDLGDTTNDGFTVELQTVAKLADLLPLDKQVRVWGNHDFGNGNTFDQSYLRQYFKNPQATTLYGGGNGYFAMIDPYYNVKYVALNNMEHNDGTRNNMMTTQQISWLIRELEKADGYDIILCSHWFLDCMGNTALEENSLVESSYSRPDEPFLYNATVYADFLKMIADRKNKASGSFTDDHGVAHSYDFSKCNSELLISWAGHDHIDFYKHMENSITQIEFDTYGKRVYAVYFCWIDRVNKKFGWWKASPYRIQSWECDIN